VMLSLGYGCGLRAGEIVRLRAGDIDKAIPGDAPNPITVDPVYDAMEARGVLIAAQADYVHAFPGLKS
jgi:integrase